SERVNALANDHRAVSRNPIRRSELPAGHSDDLGSQEKSQHALHSGLPRPAEGLRLAAGVDGRTDNDRALIVHPIGLALVASRQTVEADHAARCRPAEGLILAAGKAADKARTDHDRAVGVHATGAAEDTFRQKAEAGHGAVDPAEGLPAPAAGTKASTDHDR